MHAKSLNLFAGLVIAMTLVWAPAAQADDGDYTTAQLIAHCSANPHSCQMQIGMGIVMGLSGRCAPHSMLVPSDEQVLQVINWLRAHPDVHPDDWAAAVNAALAAIYPCAN